MRKSVLITFVIVLAATFFDANVLAANSRIEGYVKDAKTGEPLFGANIMLMGTSLGTASDMNGKYVISNLLPGSYTIRATYIGYKTEKIEIRVKEGTNIKQDFKLEPVGVEGKTVVITAQANGQAQAINQQLSSNQIINVVSAAKIQALPDANAAESVGRLPGVSVLRSGGEADQVVIRGLQPKYNEIMIDGIKMSSSDPNNRSSDLSMFSSNMLEGIQVSKTVTPDMDADVLGGTVNFVLREAKVEKPGVPRFGLLIQGSYNNLSDAYNKYNNYKYVGSAEDRFLDERLGIFAQIDIERKNLSSNELGASYNQLSNSITQYITTGFSLHDIPRDRQRYNAALNIDYKLPEGKIKFTNFLSSGSTNVINRQENFDLVNNLLNYGLGSSNNTLNTILNAIDFSQQLPVFQMDLKLSHTYSENKSPNSWSMNFMQTDAGLNQFVNTTNVNPHDIPREANYNISTASLYQLNLNNSFSRERALSASLDLKTDVEFSDVNAEIKFGGMYRHKIRSYNIDVYNGTLIGNQLLTGLIYPYFSLPSDGNSMKYWVDPNFNYGKFLNGDYSMVAPLNSGMISQLANLLNRNAKNLANQGQDAFYGINNFSSTTNNYNGYENTSAFYLMSIVKVGSEITIIPGVRYQNLQTTYTGARGLESAQSYFSYNHYDTTVTQNHGYWLPDVSLRYKPLSWFDLRLSYSNTVAYPDYNAIIPRIDVGFNSIAWNNYKLIPSRSSNYDAYLSFYNNSIGLFTVGAFLKQIKNLIYPWSFNVSGANALPYFPYSLAGSPASPTANYQVNTYVNDSYQINDYGMELDWQTHFWYLPGPLSGLVFSVNYTHIFSQASYPFTLTKITSRSIQHIDTSFVARLIDQPADIVNLTLGFDYKGFSIRVAFLYQGNIFTGANFWPQLRSYTAAYRRWDLAANQNLPWFGLQVYGNINNVNGANDLSLIQAGVPQSEQDYGMTADFGLRWNF